MRPIFLNGVALSAGAELPCEMAVKLKAKAKVSGTLLEKFTIKVQSWHCRKLLYLPRPLTFGTTRIVPEILLPPNYNTVLLIIFTIFWVQWFNIFTVHLYRSLLWRKALKRTEFRKVRCGASMSRGN